MAPNQPLNNADDTALFRLYDPSCMLQMESKVASGYLVLMGGIDKDKPQELDRGQTNLGFMALTEGNVIDACFGVKPQAGAKTSRGAKTAEEAKSMLNEAVRSSDAVRGIAVKAYGKAFGVVIQYNDDIKNLNCFTRCFKMKSINRKAEQALREAFKPLNEAIEAAS